MPAYFTIDFQYKKSDIKDNTVRDFFGNLLTCGLVYKGGYWKSQNDTLNEILLWNQQKLEEDYVLGYKEHVGNGFKQMLFQFYSFSEVRLIINNSSSHDSFSFYLIIPEDDFLEYGERKGTRQIIRLQNKMDIIEKLALQMWKIGYMSCIQTSWECSGCATDIHDIAKGIEPLIEPFAIVSEELFKKGWKCEFKKVDRNGIVLKNNNNWLHI